LKVNFLIILDCEIAVLERQEKTGKYKLTTPIRYNKNDAELPKSDFKLDDNNDNENYKNKCE
jgi:hypothetical protein